MHHTRRFRVLVVALLLLAVAIPAAASSWSVNLSVGGWSPASRWSNLFELERDVTYTYALKAYRWGWESVTGELSLTRTGSNIRMSYRVGNASGAVTAPYDPQAMVGALLLDVLSRSSVDYAGVQMLATPFKFTPWLEHFAEAGFRNGRVWEVSGQPPIRFDAQERGWRYPDQWEGEIRQGATTLLTMEIDLNEPLPVYIESRDGDYRFTAELRVQRSPGRILR